MSESQAMKVNNYKYLNDRPTTEDAIGHYKIIADKLYDTIHCNLDKPFVIGLFGSWGTGKSSIIEMLSAQCDTKEKKKTKVVIVDAWRKDKDIFNRQFLKKVGRELLTDHDYKTVNDEIEKKITDNESRWKPTKEAENLYKKYKILIWLLILFTIVYWFITREYQQVFPVDTIASAVLVWLIARYFQYQLPKYSISTNSTIENIAVHDIDHFRKIYFEKIIGKTDYTCVCIVIDNLDRVEAEDALAIIRTLKTFIVDAKEDKGTSSEVEKKSLNKVVFVVPCCDVELKKQVQKLSGSNSGNESTNGTDFLEKFFGISFRIPEFREQDSFQYARKLIDEMGLNFEERYKSTICHIIKEGYGKNPRRAKIFLNKFLMRYNVAQACEQEGKIEKGVITDHPDWLAMYMAGEGKDGQSYVKRLGEEIDPACEAAIKHLKNPNDFDLIKDFGELYQMACRNEEKFTDRLSGRASESQNIIDAIWGNINRGDVRSRTNVISAVIGAIEKNNEIIISPCVTQDMAQHISWQHPQYLRDISGKLIYERLLKEKPKPILDTLSNFGILINGVKCTEKQAQYCAEVAESVLVDAEAIFQKCQSDELNKLKQEIPAAIDRLADLSESIIPIAIKYPQHSSSVKVFNKSLEMCKGENNYIDPEDIVNYYMSLGQAKKEEVKNLVNNVIECFGAILAKYCGYWDIKEKDKNIVSKQCNNLLKALQKITNYAYNQNMSLSVNEAFWNTLNRLFVLADSRNKLEIMSLYEDYRGLDRWPPVKTRAEQFQNANGQKLLQSESEDAVCQFIENNKDLVVQKFPSFINQAAGRFKKVCFLILDIYLNRRRGVASELWDNHSEWIDEWIKDNAIKMDKDQKREIQSILLSIACSKDYPIKVYQSLSYLKVGNDKDAVDARINHFNALVQSRVLSSEDGLIFVLKRINEASYRATEGQNDSLKNGWKIIDQKAASKDLKELAKKVIKM